MTKSLLKLQAREFRKQGDSVKIIAKKLTVSRSTVSVWVRDIILTGDQKEFLMQSALSGSERGRMKSTQIRKAMRAQFITQEMQEGRGRIPELTEREILLVGLSLYWGEGSKRNGQVQFCNSDPNMIKFFVLWLDQCFSIKKQELFYWIGINEAHQKREVLVKQYWSQVLDIPIELFRKTSFKKTVNKKLYANFNEHYGTLFIKVSKSTRIYYKILGMLDVLYNMPG